MSKTEISNHDKKINRISAPQPQRPCLSPIKTSSNVIGNVKKSSPTSPSSSAIIRHSFPLTITASPTSELYPEVDNLSPSISVKDENWELFSPIKRSASYNSFLSNKIPQFASFEPPFYGRPAPVPSSPSFATLIPPSFFNPSRTSTPDDQKKENDDLVNPKTPTHEFSGFVLYLGSFITFGMYIFWAYFPDELLESIGITYYPSRTWALSIPSWTFVLIMFIYAVFVGTNLYRTPPFDSFYCITDEHANILDIKALHEKNMERRTSRSNVQKKRKIPHATLSVSGSATPSPSLSPLRNGYAVENFKEIEQALRNHVSRRAMNGSAPAMMMTGSIQPYPYQETETEDDYIPDLHDIPIQLVNRVLFEERPEEAGLPVRTRKRTISNKGPRVTEILENLKRKGIHDEV